MEIKIMSQKELALFRVSLEQEEKSEATIEKYLRDVDKWLICAICCQHTSEKD